MFKLDMEAIRKTANVAGLMANPANVANSANKPMNDPRLVSQLAKLAAIAISHDPTETDKALLTTRLLIAAMAVCDHHGDGDVAREAMRRDCLETPDELKADLLECLRFTRPQPSKVEAQALPTVEMSICAERATVTANWKDQSEAYQAHHFNCSTCIAAGRGSRYGQRCDAGIALWQSYSL
jgi:hypothetical protein